MKETLPISSYVAIGMMLFAVLIGAGNLFLPAQLGLDAGTNLWPAVIGFLITSLGLPLLGILAISFSGSYNLQALANRISPTYALIFTPLLYLIIGPFFAIPHTVNMAFEVGLTPFLSEGHHQVGFLIFTIVFFATTLLCSLHLKNLVKNVGVFLTAGIVILLSLLLFIIIRPPGAMQSPIGAYSVNPLVTGILDGYNSMNALISLIFVMVVIHVIRSIGIKSKKGILRATTISGLIAVTLLGAAYIGIAYMGAASGEAFGIIDGNGETLFNNIISHYFIGSDGFILLAILVTLASLATAIGLTTACAAYFSTFIPKYSYKTNVVLFSVLTFMIASFWLTNIVIFSVPILTFLYPLAIVLLLLAFLSPLFNHKRIVYIATTIVTCLISVFDGLKSLCKLIEIDYFEWVNPVISFYEQVLPMYNEGLGWIIPALIIITISSIVTSIQPKLKGFINRKN